MNSEYEQLDLLKVVTVQLVAQAQPHYAALAIAIELQSTLMYSNLPHSPTVLQTLSIKSSFIESRLSLRISPSISSSFHKANYTFPWLNS